MPKSTAALIERLDAFADACRHSVPVVGETGTLGGFLEPPATTPLGKAQLRQRVDDNSPVLLVSPAEPPTDPVNPSAKAAFVRFRGA
jgi:hypothetical protein